MANLDARWESGRAGSALPERARCVHGLLADRHQPAGEQRFERTRM
jgi:hypothetical protein